MKHSILVLLAAVLLAPATHGRDPFLRDGFYLGAAEVGRDGSTLFAEARHDSYESFLVETRGAGQAKRWSVPDLRINHLRRVEGASAEVVVAGSTGTAYVSRLYRLGDSPRAELLWTSTGLDPVLQNGDVEISRDGSTWSVSIYGSSSSQILAGPIDGYDSRWEWTLHAEATDPPGGSESSASALLEADHDAISIAVLWRGVLQVLSQNELPRSGTTRQLLQPPGIELTGLYFHRERNVLWATASHGQLVGFDLSELEALPRDAPLGTRYSLGPTEKDSAGREIGSILDLGSHADGRLLIHGKTANGDSIFAVRLEPNFEITRLVRAANGSRLAGAGLLEKVPGEGERSQQPRWRTKVLVVSTEGL